MRLICCFEDDSFVAAYRATQLALMRSELDGQNSKEKANDFYDLAAAKFNDTSWIPIRVANADVHEHFAEEHPWPR